MDGILNLIKPPGMTSFDISSYISRRLNGIKAGHTGTLDPGAAGLMTVCVGKATRIAPYLMAAEKTYYAELRLGATTDTLDEFGNILETRPYRYDRVRLEAVLRGFEGKSTQIPPMYSAVKLNGRKLYELARRGIDAAREKREINIKELSIIDDSDESRIMLRIVCSKGTYIRSLAADIGQAYGTGAHMGFLIRTGNGNFNISSAYTLEEFIESVKLQSVETLIIKIKDVLPGHTRIELDSIKAAAFRNGAFLAFDDIKFTKAGEIMLVFDESGDLLGMGEIINKGDKNYLKAGKML